MAKKKTSTKKTKEEQSQKITETVKTEVNENNLLTPKQGNNMGNLNKSTKYLIGTGIFGIALLLFLFITISVVRIQGNEVGVKETWSEGVVSEPLHPGTYILFPAWSQRIFTYDLSSQVFVMNDNKEDTMKNPNSKYSGRDDDPYHVQSAEGQDMAISLNVRWRIDSTKIVDLHKTVRSDFEEKIVRTVVMRVVKDEATTRKAIDAYSGEGLVKLQVDIQKDLTSPQGELAQRGIIVESFVIEGIKLDPTYIGEIRSRQVATQRKLRADEETKAAEAEALKAKADAQADFNKRVVEAERDQRVAVLKAEQEGKAAVIAAEADAKKVKLAADADASKVVTAAKAEQDAGFLKAKAVEALGKAEAEATKLKLLAYTGHGADNFTKIKVAEEMARSMWSVKGYLPSDMTVNVLSENFIRSIENFLGHKGKE